jgi:hypothetical protein
MARATIDVRTLGTARFIGIPHVIDVSGDTTEESRAATAHC